MRGKAEQDPHRERADARDQTDRSDNTASRACSFEVSAEHSERTILISADFRDYPIINTLSPFSRKR